MLRSDHLQGLPVPMPQFWNADVETPAPRKSASWSLKDRGESVGTLGGVADRFGADGCIQGYRCRWGGVCAGSVN